MILRILNWPARKGSPLFPWWRITWNFLCLPFVWVGIGLLMLGCFLQHGPKEAANLWEILR